MSDHLGFTRSPRVERLSWGRLEIEGAAAPLKDAKLYPGGCREWDWRETGTRHVPGVQPSDVEELLEHGATVVVLSTGMLGRLKVPAETIEYLAGRGVSVRVQGSRRAVETYNELRGAEPVGALIHSTC